MACYNIVISTKDVFNEAVANYESLLKNASSKRRTVLQKRL